MGVTTFKLLKCQCSRGTGSLGGVHGIGNGRKCHGPVCSAQLNSMACRDGLQPGSCRTACANQTWSYDVAAFQSTCFIVGAFLSGVAVHTLVWAYYQSGPCYLCTVCMCIAHTVDSVCHGIKHGLAHSMCCRSYQLGVSVLLQCTVGNVAYSPKTAEIFDAWSIGAEFLIM